jgi:hypothetical protein
MNILLGVGFLCALRRGWEAVGEEKELDLRFNGIDV